MIVIEGLVHQAMMTLTHGQGDENGDVDNHPQVVHLKGERESKTKRGV